MKISAKPVWVHLMKSSLVRVLSPPQPSSENDRFSDEIWVPPRRIWMNIAQNQLPSEICWVLLHYTDYYWDVQTLLFLVQVHIDMLLYRPPLSLIKPHLDFPCSPTLSPYHKGLEEIKIVMICSSGQGVDPCTSQSTTWWLQDGMQARFGRKLH